MQMTWFYITLTKELNLIHNWLLDSSLLLHREKIGTSPRLASVTESVITTNECYKCIFKSKNAMCKLGDWYVVDQTLLRLLRSVSKQINLVLLSFPLYGSLASCLFHLNIKVSK